MAGNLTDKDMLNIGGFRTRSEPVDRGPIPSLNRAPAEPGTERMFRHKEEVSGHVSDAVSEIERLRMRQEELEKEKNVLQDLTKKQDDYEMGKREMIDKLNRGMILLEKDESHARRMVELLSETRSKFQETLSELKTINESSWADEEFAEQLSRALAKVEIARDMHKRAMAKIDASNWQKAAAGQEVSAQVGQEVCFPRGFGFWLKVGLAVSLPLIAALILLFLGYLFCDRWILGSF